MRRSAVRVLGLVLLGVLLCSVRAHAGDPELPALERYLAAVKARGEPVTLDALMGPPAPSEDNGVPHLVLAMRLVEGRESQLRGKPDALWDEAGAVSARAN